MPPLHPHQDEHVTGSTGSMCLLAAVFRATQSLASGCTKAPLCGEVAASRGSKYFVSVEQAVHESKEGIEL